MLFSGIDRELLTQSMGHKALFLSSPLIQLSILGNMDLDMSMLFHNSPTFVFYQISISPDIRITIISARTLYAQNTLVNI